jgi:hypothetical protein
VAGGLHLCHESEQDRLHAQPAAQISHVVMFSRRSADRYLLQRKKKGSAF